MQGDSGAAENTTINSGGVQYDEGSATGTTINYGGQQFIETDDVADNTTINNGGLQVVEDEGLASGTTISGGQQLVDSYGSASNTFVTCDWITPNNSYYPGIQTINLDGSVNDTRVGFGGDVYVSSGGSSSDLSSRAVAYLN